MTPVTTDKYDMSKVPPQYREAFMLTAYIIRDALKAVRALQAVGEGHALFDDEQRGRLYAVEHDISSAFDTYAHFLGNKVGPSGYGDKLGVGAEQDVLAIAAIEVLSRFKDQTADDDYDHEYTLARELAISRNVARIVAERMKS